MGTIQLTPQPARGHGPRASALTQAAMAALRAPSIFNTQPWRWRLTDDAAELRFDRGRQLRVVDPDGRFMILSCGIALDHARTALAAAGYEAAVERFPDPDQPDLLARLRAVDEKPLDPHDMRMYQATLVRRTDRRPFTGPPIPDALLRALVAVAESRGAHLHAVPPGQVTALTVAAGHAAEVEMADPAYRAELAQWTHRDPRRGDGVPADTAVPPTPRRVPVRDFAPGQPFEPEAVEGADRNTRYLILFTNSDDRHAWLAAGEALSAVLLLATTEDLAASPMSDVVEVPAARHLLRDLLSGIGHPMIALRVGIAEPASASHAPRRSASEIVDVDRAPSTDPEAGG